MCTDGLQYGILQTYEQWWFLKRDENGTLFISSAYDRLATDPLVLCAVLAILELAKKAPTLAVPFASTFSPVTKPPVTKKRINRSNSSTSNVAGGQKLAPAPGLSKSKSNSKRKSNSSGKPNHRPGVSEVIGGKTHLRRFGDIDFAQLRVPCCRRHA
jgi:hypothetical protein